MDIAETSVNTLNPNGEVKVENDFSSLCRVCMSKNNDMKNAFLPEPTQIVEKLEFCTGILMNQEDGLPNKLCDACLSSLSTAYKFKNACLLADKFFRNILGQKALSFRIKKEVDGDYNDTAPKQEVEDDIDKNDIQDDYNDAEECKKVHKPKTKALHVKKKTKTAVVSVKKKLNRLQCEVCDLRFASSQQSLQHRRDVHGYDWICEICGKQFMHRASHYSHVRSHLPPQYKCAHCDYKTSHRADLNKHNLIHTDTKKYVCEYCTQSFRTTSNLYDHIRRNHGGPKSHSCGRCQRAFHSADKLRRHVDSHDNVKRYECSVCHSLFTRRCHWKRHLQKQHSVAVPQIRPGRRKANLVVGEQLTGEIKA